MKRTRRPLQRPRKRTFLLVVEGERTEYDYFVGCRQDPRVRAAWSVIIKHARSGSAAGIIEKAISLRDQGERDGDRYDQVWCVLDCDTLYQDPDDRSQIARAWKEGIKLALSNPVFEVWYLSHYVQTHRVFELPKGVEDELTRHWPEYAKNSGDHFHRLESKLPQAKANAAETRRCHGVGPNDVYLCNSATNVDILMTALGL